MEDAEPLPKGEEAAKRQVRAKEIICPSPESSSPFVRGLGGIFTYRLMSWRSQSELPAPCRACIRSAHRPRLQLFGCAARDNPGSPGLSPRGRLRRACRHIFRRLGFHSGLAQKFKVAKPIDEPVLPGSKRRVVAILQSIRMNAVPIDMHLQIRNLRRQKRPEILIGPIRVLLIIGACARNKRRRCICGNRGIGIARKRRRTGINQPDEMRPGTPFIMLYCSGSLMRSFLI